jgi:hypothetical protein
VLDEVFERLTEEGAEHWPNAWCEEDIADEADQRLRDIDYEEYLIEEREKRLTKQLKSLQADKQTLSDEIKKLVPIVRAADRRW